MNNISKKSSTLLIIMLLSVAGCRKKCLEKTIPVCNKQPEVSTPLTQEPKEQKSVFDEDVDEFSLVDEPPVANNPSTPTKQASKEIPEESFQEEFSWIEEEEQPEQQALKSVYFDFNKYAIKQDQETSVDQNVKTIKTVLNKNNKQTIVVEGHSCHSAGSAAYNLALSEKRAKVLADRLVASGVSRDKIKVVGRGQECPALDTTGKPCTGTREQQWLNRRDELNLVKV